MNICASIGLSLSSLRSVPAAPLCSCFRSAPFTSAASATPPALSRIRGIRSRHRQGHTLISLPLPSCSCLAVRSLRVVIPLPGLPMPGFGSPTRSSPSAVCWPCPCLVDPCTPGPAVPLCAMRAVPLPASPGLPRSMSRSDTDLPVGVPVPASFSIPLPAPSLSVYWFPVNNRSAISSAVPSNRLPTARGSYLLRRGCPFPLPFPRSCRQDFAQSAVAPYLPELVPDSSEIAARQPSLPLRPVLPVSPTSSFRRRWSRAPGAACRS